MKNKLNVLNCIILISLNVVSQAEINVTSTSGVAIINGRVVSQSKNLIEGSGNVKTETLTLHPFDTIEINLPINVNIQVGENSFCVITADDNILPLLITDVDNDILTIDSKKDFVTYQKLSISITTQHLSKVVVNGSGDVNISGVKDNKLNLETNGTGNIIATGQVNNLNVQLNGAGDMKLYDLKALAAEVSLNGAGTIQIFASDTFSGELIGSGDITIRGNPKILRSNIVGAGDIEIK